MATPIESGKVIDLQLRQGLHASETDRLGELLKTARTAALKRIGGLLGTLFENLDDALFDLAEKAENNSVQNHYFDGMREVRKKRQLVDRLFQEQLSNLFNDFASGKLQAVRADTMSNSAPIGLALLDDCELEESLAINSMIAKAESRFARGLYGLNQRLSVIRAGTKVEDASNPIGPAPLCHAFRIAVQEFEITVAVKLIVFKLFERFVLGGLEPLYDEVNALLIKAGVLPQTPFVAQTRGMNNAGMQQNTNDQYGNPTLRQDQGGYPQDFAQQQAPMADPAAAVNAQLQSEIYQTLRQLLASRHTPNAPEYAANTYMPTQQLGMPTHVPQAHELLNALSLLQHQTIAAQQQAQAAATPMATMGQVQQVKQELLGQLNKFSAETQNVSHADEDTIDLVGMLFEFIVQDRNLPSEMQALLSRLQIPYLKVALLDRHLFAQKAHPARRLLDAMAEASVGWSPDSDTDQRLFEQVKHTVNELLHNFDDDVGIFERLHRDFVGFTSSQKRRIDLTEQRVTEAARGREKLSLARISAAREIRLRLEDPALPDLVRHVLARPWGNFLTLIFVRHGEASAEWQSALRFMDDLIWSVSPKPGIDDRLRLKMLLPSLENTLRNGLTTVAYHESDMRRVIEDLRKLHARALIAKPVAESRSVQAMDPHEFSSQRSPVVSHDSAAAQISGEDFSEDAAPEEFPLPQMDATLAAAISSVETRAETSSDNEFMQRVRSMKVGTWLQFEDSETGNQERAKLSWISPISGRYLFVNNKGLKVADKTADILARELESGDATLMDDVPLFDRALGAIAERLKAAPPVAT
ncbi:DUF1631 domain-containing protein [Pseudolysobacter antarcticus]|uniref:DUF1631 domain-containing protein n=1 Tax=Pseudolysobacter antarcticus TaxID=2511995 RepID=A0A411HH40_9GAMM|nr:DUF1631 domain-containing protein [Pseudolysobacter antarcticus]QBB69822.1 DUF1631 domain-containing protein [Pseudolysobacter antarcticus]